MVIWLLCFPATAATLTGTVQGENGDPLPDTEVLAINTRLQAARTHTSAEGRFSFPLLPDGSYRVWVLPSDDDVHTPRYFPSASNYCDGEVLTLRSTPVDIQLVLPVGEQISGAVFDSDSSAVAGTRIRAVAIDGAASRESWTNTDGVFELKGLEAGTEWQLQAAVSGWPIQWWDGHYEQTESPLLPADGNPTLPGWTLLDGVAVQGQVTGPEGPVPDAAVRAYGGGQIVQSISDTGGNYFIEGLPPGDITTWVTADGLANTYLPDNDRPTEVVEVPDEGDVATDIDMEMPWEATAHIVLTGEAPRTNGDLSDLTVTLYNDTNTVGRGDQTDGDGDVTISGLHGGSYAVFVYGSDAGHPDDWIRDENGDPVTIVLDHEEDNGPFYMELQPATTVDGTVVDDHGVPIPGAAVVLSAPGNQETAESGQALFLETTDKEGRFSIVGVPAGEWDAKVQLAPWCESDPGFVTAYWRGEIDPLMADPLRVDLADPIQTIQFTMPRDDDHDGMGDRWERRYDLDLTRDDALEDPDNDGLPNLYEYRMRTDPHKMEGYWTTETRCGCASGGSKGGLLWVLAVLVAVRRRDASERHTPAPRAG